MAIEWQGCGDPESPRPWAKGKEEKNLISTGAVAHQERQSHGVEEWKPGREEVQFDLAVPDPDVAATRAINTLDITDCDAANIAIDAK